MTVSFSALLTAQGFNENDRINFFTKPREGNVNNESLFFSDVISQLRTPPDELNCYISHACHGGGSRFTEEDYVAIPELVIDIDYGEYHKQKTKFITKEEAEAALSQLPQPTIVVNTGGGFQVHYRFSRRLGQDCFQRYKKLSQMVSKIVGGDSCHHVGHVFRLPYTWNLKDDFPARKSDVHEFNPGIEYSLDQLEAWAEKHAPALVKKGKAEAERIRCKKSKLKSTDGKGKDRSQKCFYFIEDFLLHTPDAEERTILAKLKRHPFFNHYAERGDQADDLCRQDIRRIKRKLTEDKWPKPKNEIVRLEYKGELPSKVLISVKQRFDDLIYPSTSPSFVATLHFLEDCYINKRQAIMDFPCGAGKTTAAIELIVANASPKNRFWFVTEKIEDVKAVTDKLKRLEVKAVEWHGRPESICPISRMDFKRKKAKLWCSECQSPCTAKIKYTSPDKWDNEEYDVIVTTHSHWQAAIAAEKIPASVKCVIVDEAPSLTEYYVLTPERKANIEKFFADDSHMTEIFSSEINTIKHSLENGDCLKVMIRNTTKHKTDICKYAYKRWVQGLFSTEELDELLTFMNFFDCDGEVYGMIERPDGSYNNQTMTFIRGTVNIRTTIPHIILDGSAVMSDVYWEGFKIYSADCLKPKYPHTTIHIVDGTPSKRKLCDGQFFAKLENEVLGVISEQSPVILFQNKNQEQTQGDNLDRLRKRLIATGTEVIVMNRGEHKGSNKGRKGRVNAICMSMFNTVPYYVLRTALATGNEIPVAKIWRNKFKSPSMKKNGGFNNGDIQLTYCRSLTVDLYQTIMRGCIRINPTVEYDVVCVVKGLDIITLLKGEFPGARLVYDESWIVDELAKGKSDAEITQMMPGDDLRKNRERLALIKAELGL